MEGDGNTNKGLKAEWATVKDGVLHVGSFGKEYVDADTGLIISSYANLWIAKISSSGSIVYENWTDNYNRLRFFIFIFIYLCYLLIDKERERLFIDSLPQKGGAKNRVFFYSLSLSVLDENKLRNMLNPLLSNRVQFTASRK